MKPAPMAEDDSKLDLLLEKYKDYVLGSQNVYFTGSKLALDKKETKAAISAYTTNKIIGELNDLSEVIFELFNNNDLEDEQIDNELLQSVIKTCIIELKALQKEES